jgi:hypothetical protein
MFAYSEFINRFHDMLGVEKPEIEEVFNKPDVTDIIGGNFVSVKRYEHYAVLITFHESGDFIRFASAYKILPKLFDKDIMKMKPSELLFTLMEKYGRETDMPGIGRCKIFIDVSRKIFFPGVLEIEKYLDDVKKVYLGEN